MTWARRGGAECSAVRGVAGSGGQRGVRYNNMGRKNRRRSVNAKRAALCTIIIAM